MKKQDLNVFNISFLDLMTGAFAAVIILFIIVPKLSKEERKAIEKLEKLKVELNDMDSIILRLKSSIPEGEYVAMVKQSSKIQGTMHDLEVEIENLRKDLLEERGKNETLLGMVDSLQAELGVADSLANRYWGLYEDLTERVKELEQENERLRKKQEKVAWADDSTKIDQYVPVKDTAKQAVIDTANLVKEQVTIAPLEAPLGVVATWDDPKTDIDLYLKKDNQYCYNYVRNQKMPFGQWIKVKKYRAFFNEKTTEIIVQDDKLKPGEYEVLLHQRLPKSGETAVKVTITFSPPGKIPQQMVIEDTVKYTKDAPYRSGGKLVGQLTVTENGISFRESN